MPYQLFTSLAQLIQVSITCRTESVSQHSSASACQPANHILALLHEVPPLSEVLNDQAIRVLSETCKGLRKWFLPTARTQVITLRDAREEAMRYISTTAKPTYPNLQVVVVITQDPILHDLQTRFAATQLTTTANTAALTVLAAHPDMAPPAMDGKTKNNNLPEPTAHCCRPPPVWTQPAWPNSMLACAPFQLPHAAPPSSARMLLQTCMAKAWQQQPNCRRNR